MMLFVLMKAVFMPPISPTVSNKAAKFSSFFHCGQFWLSR
jgi:hypothetical protein